MKTYDYITYNGDWGKLISDFNQEVQTKLPIKIESSVLGSGEITSVKAKVASSALEAQITYTKKSEIKELHTLLSTDVFQFAEPDRQALNEMLKTFRAAYGERIKYATEKALKDAAERRAKQEELERQIKERKAKEATERRIKKYNEKLAERMSRDTANFQADESEIAPFSPTAELYYSLGWLSKHIGAVSAALPKWLGPEFERHFGTEAPKSLKEGLTSGGHEMQRDYSFRCSLTKLKSTTIPAYLQTYVTEDNKGIHNTKFIWNLVDNYGFKFGKTQDVDTIKSLVPSTYLTYFEAGFAA